MALADRVSSSASGSMVSSPVSLGISTKESFTTPVFRCALSSSEAKPAFHASPSASACFCASYSIRSSWTYSSKEYCEMG